MLNGSALCPPDVLDALIGACVEEVSGKYQLEVIPFKKECFDMS